LKTATPSTLADQIASQFLDPADPGYEVRREQIQSTIDAANKAAQSGPRETVVRPLQIGLLRDVQDMALQTRFEQFMQRTTDTLTQRKDGGDPVFNAGTAESTFSVKVTIKRTANDALAFSVAHKVHENHPQVPGKVRASFVVAGVCGLGQKVFKDAQMSLLDAEDNQPKPVNPSQLPVEA